MIETTRRRGCPILPYSNGPGGMRATGPRLKAGGHGLFGKTSPRSPQSRDTVCRVAFSFRIHRLRKRQAYKASVRWPNARGSAKRKKFTVSSVNHRVEQRSITCQFGLRAKLAPLLELLSRCGYPSVCRRTVAWRRRMTRNAFVDPASGRHHDRSMLKWWPKINARRLWLSAGAGTAAQSIMLSAQCHV